MATGLEKVSFHFNPKERPCQIMLICTIALISHASKVMLKKQYVKQELPNVRAGFSKGRGTRDQIANICWIIEKAREFQKNIYYCFMTIPKTLTVWITTNWKILQEMGIPDFLTCLWRNLYAGQEVTVKIRHGTKN